MRHRKHTGQTQQDRKQRRCRFELMESRRMLDANPLLLGAVYTEEDLGTDNQRDSLQITFEGGAANTEVTRIVIDGDQVGNFGNVRGFSSGDIFFDTQDGGLGVDDALDLQTELISSGNGPAPRVTGVQVVDGSSFLVINLENFTAGDQLVLRLDVDEAEVFNPNVTDIDIINSGFDPLTSGAEFAGSFLSAEVQAPNFRDADGMATFVNAYDTTFARANQLGLTLELPGDNANLNRDRTAGALIEIQQVPEPITISGNVFFDRDADAQMEPAEFDRGIADVTLELWRQGGSGYEQVVHNGAALSTTSDANGFYQFGEDLDLMPGVYQIREQQPTGYTSVAAIPGDIFGADIGSALSVDVITDLSIPLGGQHAANNDFAETRPALISGSVYHDRDNDGVMEAGEEGIAQTVIQLFDADARLVATTQTDGNGDYRFDNLTPGVYSVVELQPTRWIDGKEAKGQVDRLGVGVIALGQTGGDRFDQVELKAEEAAVDFDFGERLGSIAGSVFSDRDGDCYFDQHEVGIAGVTMTLVDQDGNQITTTTDADGAYEFTDLSAGEYTILQTQPVGYFQGGQVAGSGGGDATEANRIDSIFLGLGDVELKNYDFCEQLGSISGYVYHDRDNDGAIDSGEESIADVRIQLQDQTGQLQETFTNDDGYYVFADLGPGVYEIREFQPDAWIDGIDTLGQVSAGDPGLVSADRFVDVQLAAGDEPIVGEQFNFGERKGSISGVVHIDTNGNCIVDEDEQFLSGVTIHLLDDGGALLATTLTDADGVYRFDNLGPGEYFVVERQPDGLFHAGQVVGSHGGDASFDDVLGELMLDADAVHLTDYNFCEAPPSRLSGYVFQDGPPIEMIGGGPPDNIRHFRDGLFTPDDTPIAGVVLELRDGLTGAPIDASMALPGVYPAGPIRAVTDAEGFYEFSGIRGGASYAVFEIQPEDYLDGIDTAGTTSGVAINPDDNVDSFFLAPLTEDPNDDAIIRIPLSVGQSSELNNFSEILVGDIPPPPPPPPPPEPPRRYPEPPANEVLPTYTSPQKPTKTEIPVFVTGGPAIFSWHLSVINGGAPRGQLPDNGASQSTWADVSLNNAARWRAETMRNGVWSQFDPQLAPDEIGRHIFGAENAIPVAGDFNGDGISDIGVFIEGHWYLDLNGNGVWDDGDLWAKLGSQDDLPVVGDWDADGKDDIGIFGPMWEGDPNALRHERGVPDVANRSRVTAKNVPPTPEEATNGERLLQRTERGRVRSDLIDHVFQFGEESHRPIAGDFNGDGVSTIGVYSKGEWKVDSNGDGRWEPNVDATYTFGKAGDIPLVADLNGDGVDQLSVVRDGKWIVDSDGDRELTAHDRVFELEGNGYPVAGDWNGDGRDEIGFFDPARPGDL